MAFEQQKPLKIKNYKIYFFINFNLVEDKIKWLIIA